MATDQFLFMSPMPTSYHGLPAFNNSVTSDTRPAKRRRSEEEPDFTRDGGAYPPFGQFNPLLLQGAFQAFAQPLLGGINAQSAYSSAGQGGLQEPPPPSLISAYQQPSTGSLIENGVLSPFSAIKTSSPFSFMVQNSSSSNAYINASTAYSSTFGSPPSCTASSLTQLLMHSDSCDNVIIPSDVTQLSIVCSSSHPNEGSLDYASMNAHQAFDTSTSMPASFSSQLLPTETFASIPFTDSSQYLPYSQSEDIQFDNYPTSTTQFPTSSQVEIGPGLRFQTTPPTKRFHSLGSPSGTSPISPSSTGMMTFAESLASPQPWQQYVGVDVEGDYEYSSEQSDCDERVIVPATTPLSESFEDLTQIKYENTASLSVERHSSVASIDRKKRSPMGEDKRKATNEARSMGACMRCHIQRIRCHPNPLYPDNPHSTCGTCLNFSKVSKKTIHNLPCLRDKLTMITIYRSGGLNITRRFNHTQVVDVGDHADNTIHIIEMTQGICRTPVRLNVRRFRPLPTDDNDRRYNDRGLTKEYHLEPFALADVEKTAAEFDQYLTDNALDGLSEAVKNSDDIVKWTFRMIAEECRLSTRMPKTNTAQTPKEVQEQKKRAEDQAKRKHFLCQAVRLWFAIQHGIGSAWLTEESDNLGMTPISDRNDHLYGQVPIPRMLIAQFDSIRHQRIYKRLAPEVLKSYEFYITSSNKEAWFTVFLVTFLFLHQVASNSSDRRRRLKANTNGTPHDTRYGPTDDPLTKFIEDVQRGGVMLLAYWQYFKRTDLMNFDWDKVGNSQLQCLDPEQVDFMKKIIGLLNERVQAKAIPETPAEGCWEHELFWISRMFESTPKEQKWTPPEAFTREKPSVGREF